MIHSRQMNTRLGFPLVALLIALSACQTQIGAQDQVPGISSSTLKERFDAGDDLLVVDALTSDEYVTRRIPGSISVLRSELETSADEFTRDREIVSYCT